MQTETKERALRLTLRTEILCRRRCATRGHLEHSGGRAGRGAGSGWGEGPGPQQPSLGADTLPGDKLTEAGESGCGGWGHGRTPGVRVRVQTQFLSPATLQPLTFGHRHPLWVQIILLKLCYGVRMEEAHWALCDSARDGGTGVRAPSPLFSPPEAAQPDPHKGGWLPSTAATLPLGGFQGGPCLGATGTPGSISVPPAGLTRDPTTETAAPAAGAGPRSVWGRVRPVPSRPF